MLFQHTIDSVIEYLEHTICCCFRGVWNDMRPVPFILDFGFDNIQVLINFLIS